MAIKIWVNEELLDVVEDTQLTIKSCSSLFETEVVRGEFSFPFKIPLTQRNSRIMGFPEQMSIVEETFVFNAELERLGSISSGVLYIDSVEFNHKLQIGVAECTFAGTDGRFFQLIDGKKMWQLTYGGSFAVPAYTPYAFFAVHSNACRYATDVTDGTITGLPFVFPMIKWENFGIEIFMNHLCNGFVNYWQKTPQDGVMPGDCFAFYYREKPPLTDVTYQRLIPMFKTKWLLEKIFEEFGFTIDFGTFDSLTFQADILINSFSINKWSFDDTVGLTPAFIDNCSEINPANHVPDITVADFLNIICTRFNGQFIYTGPDSYEFVLKQDVITSPLTTAIPNHKISPVVIKKLSETVEAQKGINLEYTSTDQFFDDSVLKDTDLALIKGEVDEQSDLPGIASPAHNDIWLVKEMNRFYQYDSSLGYFIPYCYNFINQKNYDNGNDLSIEAAPLVNDFIVFDHENIGTWTSYEIICPKIDAQGNNFADEYTAGYPLATDLRVTKSERTYLPARFMLWYGLTDCFNPINNYRIPYSSGSSYDGTLTLTKVYAWSLSLYGEDGIWEVFYKRWNNVLTKTTKYQLQVYLGEHDVNALSFKEFIAALEQKFLLYSRAFTEPYRDVATLEVYKIPYYLS
jgi:hypothetical protein